MVWANPGADSSAATTRRPGASASTLRHDAQVEPLGAQQAADARQHRGLASPAHSEPGGGRLRDRVGRRAFRDPAVHLPAQQPRALLDHGFRDDSQPTVCTQTVEGGDPDLPGASVRRGRPQILQDRTYNRLQLREVATFVTEGAGHHVVKAGVEFELTTYGSKRAYSGGVSYQDNAGGTFVNDFRRYGGLTGPDEPYTLPYLDYDTRSISVGGFLQDSWSIMDKVTLNVGRALRRAVPVRRTTGRSPSRCRTSGRRASASSTIRPRGPREAVRQLRALLRERPARHRRPRRLRRAADPLAGADAGLRPASPTAARTAGCDDPANLVTVPGKGPYDPNQRWAVRRRRPGRRSIPTSTPQSTGRDLARRRVRAPRRRPHVGVTYTKRWLNNIDRGHEPRRGVDVLHRQPGLRHRQGLPGGAARLRRGHPGLHRRRFADGWLAQASYTLS